MTQTNMNTGKTRPVREVGAKKADKDEKVKVHDTGVHVYPIISAPSAGPAPSAPATRPPPTVPAAPAVAPAAPAKKGGAGFGTGMVVGVGAAAAAGVGIGLATGAITTDDITDAAITA